MKKSLTISRAKAHAWEVFSLYIRTRDRVTETDSRCFTCDKIHPIKEGQAGHWIPGRHNSVLFDERNCHDQCFQCNIKLHGNPVVYYDRMLAKYGKDICEELKRLDRQTTQFKVFELIEIRNVYRIKLQELLHGEP